jgi:hypothetical protein
MLGKIFESKKQKAGNLKQCTFRKVVYTGYLMAHGLWEIEDSRDKIKKNPCSHWGSSLGCPFHILITTPKESCRDNVPIPFSENNFIHYQSLLKSLRHNSFFLT